MPEVDCENDCPICAGSGAVVCVACGGSGEKSTPREAREYVAFSEYLKHAMTSGEVASWLGISERQLRRYVDQGAPGRHGSGTKVRWNWHEIFRWVMSRRIAESAGCTVEEAEASLRADETCEHPLPPGAPRLKKNWKPDPSIFGR